MYDVELLRASPFSSCPSRHGLYATFSRTHHERVVCGTPIAAAYCLALTACGPTNRFTMQRIQGSAQYIDRFGPFQCTSASGA